ncbi:MATE family efflux transporter [Actinoallomurus acaciae]|uniref:Probable multidrug resistance protein NorM n=1 Tax=Actinoallomurus acaciae TaxID=502577 RepID=A0ABV5YRK5_9ACTN
MDQAGAEPSRTAMAKALIVLSGPLALANAAMIFAGLFDVYVAGRVGVDAQAAVGLGAMLSSLAVFFFAGVTNGIVPMVSQYAGAGQARECGETLVQGIVIALAGGAFLILVALAVPLARPQLAGLAGARVGALTASYISIRLLSGPFFLLILCVNKFLTGIHDTRPNILIGVGSSALECLLSYTLGLGAFGVPALGLKGIAWAYAIAQLAGAAVALGVCLLGPSRRRYPVRIGRRPVRPDLLRSLLALGVPLGAAQVFNNGSYLILSVVAARLGPEAAAAHAVASQVLLLPQRGLEVLGSAGSSLVGKYVGAGSRARAVRQHWVAMAVGCGLAGVIGIILWAFRGGISGLLSPDAGAAAVTAGVFVVIALSMVPRAVMAVAQASLSAVGDVRIPSLTIIVGRWALLVPMTLFLVFWLDGGVVGVWEAETLSVVVLAAMLLVRLVRGRRFDRPLAPSGAERTEALSGTD